jgi:hypothetical protein
VGRSSSGATCVGVVLIHVVDPKSKISLPVQKGRSMFVTMAVTVRYNLFELLGETWLKSSQPHGGRWSLPFLYNVGSRSLSSEDREIHDHVVE